MEVLHNINKNRRDTNSHKSKDDNNQWHIPEIEHRPKTPSFLHGEEQEDEDEVNEVNNINEYSRIDPKLRREIPFKDSCDA